MICNQNLSGSRNLRQYGISELSALHKLLPINRGQRKAEKLNVLRKGQVEEEAVKERVKFIAELFGVVA